MNDVYLTDAWCDFHTDYVEAVIRIDHRFVCKTCLREMISMIDKAVFETGTCTATIQTAIVGPCNLTSNM